MYSEEGWRPDENWDRKVLNDYKEIAGWQPVNPIGALSFINFIADAILKELVNAGGVMLADDQTEPVSNVQREKDWKRVKPIVRKEEEEESTDAKT